MTRDDKVNIAILIAALLFGAIAFPTRYQEHRDATYGQAIKSSMSPNVWMRD